MRGIDGALYHAGEDHAGAPVVVVFSPGYQETIPALWPTDDWAHHRTLTEGRFLAVSTWRPSRADHEDLVLAYLLQRPRELADLGGWVPVDTFTTHVRYGIYEAMLALHTEGEPVIPSAIKDRVRHSTDELSPHLAKLVASTTDTAAYLRRLMLTPSTSIEALEAAVSLVMADWRAASDASQTDLRHQPPARADNLTEAIPIPPALLQDQI
ncbi:DnaB-like helicase N-terminal domain-containing protein [Kitasatospora sp. GP30]|uniref:DnaB-like helicase N-terminal domain-containing protein n=1 Tax=Kitasatospora sp. GP30 TaxID=3035084 RepID=UPI0015D5F91F|nr:DnaB-like helicase N-terminal domain-containing protein [Kitasatospora sp. GP30]